MNKEKLADAILITLGIIMVAAALWLILSVGP